MADFTLDTSEFEAGMEHAHTAMINGAGDGLEKLANRIMNAAQGLCPKDTGTLVSTAMTAVDRGSLTAAIGFGSGAEPVNAVVQHERLDYVHYDGQAKYLEIPFISIGTGEGAEIIASAIDLG